MSDFQFVGYVGDRDFHDGYVRRVEQDGDVVRVIVEGFSGTRYLCEFRDVQSVDAHEPKDMMLYGLSHWRNNEGIDVYAFANWKWEEDDARLKVQAKDFRIEVLETNK